MKKPFHSILLGLIALLAPLGVSFAGQHSGIGPGAPFGPGPKPRPGINDSRMPAERDARPSAEKRVPLEIRPVDKTPKKTR